MNIANYDLDDSLVIDFYKQNHSIILKLEDITIPTEKFIDGVLTLHGVSNISIKINKIDDINPHQEIGMFHQYGQLLGLKIENHSISFLIEWNNMKIYNTFYYSMNFDHLTLEIIGAEREIPER
jgi:hypothetical protein